MLRPEEKRALPLSRGAVLAVGDDGRIAYCSAAALELLGWSANLVGQSLSAIIPHRLHKKHQEGFAKFSMARRPTTAYPRLQPARGEHGGEREVQVAVVVYRRPDTSLFLCSALALPGAMWPSLGATHTELLTSGYTVVAPEGEALEILISGPR